MLRPDLQKQLVQAQMHLIAYAYTLTRNEPDAFDLYQEACLRALERFEEIRSPDTFLPWLRTVMRHLFFEWQRRKPMVSLDAVPVDIADDCRNEYEAGRFDLRDELQVSLPKLKPSLQRFVSAVLAHHTTEAVCDVLGIERPTFRMYLSRLRKDLAELGYETALTPTGWELELAEDHPLTMPYAHTIVACRSRGIWLEQKEDAATLAILQAIYEGFACLLILYAKTPQSHD